VPTVLWSSKDKKQMNRKLLQHLINIIFFYQYEVKLNRVTNDTVQSPNEYFFRSTHFLLEKQIYFIKFLDAIIIINKRTTKILSTHPICQVNLPTKHKQIE